MINEGSRAHRALLYRAIAAALLVGSAAPALAQDAGRAVPAGESRQAQVDVDIPAKPLRAALEQFALQTGIQVVYAGDGLVRDLRSPAVSGRLTPDAALRALLAGSGLRHAFVNATTVSIERAPAAAVAAPAPSTAAASQSTPEIRVSNDFDVTDMDVVVVTGTNLRNIDPASPLIVVDSQQIERAGYSSIEDVLRHLPQNFSSRTSTSAALGETEFGDSFSPRSAVGASSINLRGLGSRSTLVLVNGRRLAGSAQGQGAFTDISSIPLSQVDRIEVLSDGASAIYGADAVAGVVNIVLKESYSGTQVQLRNEWSSSDADASVLNLAHTFGWSDGSLSVSASLRKSKPADTSRFIRVGPGGIGDFTQDGGLYVRTPDVGQPGVVFEAVPDGVGGYVRGTPLGIIPPGQDGTSLQPGDLLPYDPATSPSTYWSHRIGPSIDSPSLRISGEQRLGHDLKLTYGASYTRQRNEERWRPSAFDFNFMQYGTTTFVPAANVHNPFGQDVLVGYSYDKEYAGMQFSQQQTQTNANYNVGLSGKLPWTKSWDFDVSFADSRERGRSDDLYGISFLGENSAIENFSNNINPFGDGSDPEVVEANRALLNSLVGSYDGTFDSRMRSLDLLTSGDLFSLPGGKAQLAVGAQFRDERYHLATEFGGASKYDADRKVRAGFAELGLPLLKDLPWAKELTLSLATRHESFDQNGTSSLQHSGYTFDFDTFETIDLVALGGFDLKQLTGLEPGGVPYERGPSTTLHRSYSNTSSQVRLAWKPADGLRLRATWGQSFLTPNTQQQFGDGSVEEATYAILFNGGTIPDGVSSVVALRGPNPGLKPQLATVRTFGFDYNPAAAQGLTVSMTYNDTRFENFIGDPLAGLSYAQIFSDISKMPPEVFTMGENGVLLWDAREVNFLGRRSRTVDSTIDYAFDNRLGDWSMRLNAVRTLELSARSLPSFPNTEFSDSEYGPGKWAAELTTSWARGNWFASAGAHYSSGFRVLYPLSAERNFFNDFTPVNTDPRRHAGSYTTMDFQVGYDGQQAQGWLHDATIRLGVQNAFNRDFPFVDNQYGFISNRVNVRGRVIYLDLKKEF